MSAHGLKITNFHYTNTVLEKFEPTVYPKWVYPEPMSKKGQLVNDEAEEAAYLKALETKAPLPDEVPALTPSKPASSNILAGPNNEEEVLLKIASEKSIKVDGRWSLQRLRAAVEKALTP